MTKSQYTPKINAIVDFSSETKLNFRKTLFNIAVTSIPNDHHFAGGAQRTKNAIDSAAGAVDHDEASIVLHTNDANHRFL
jgi:hypothetical protein